MIDLWEARPRVTCKPSVVHKLQDDAEGDAIDRAEGRALQVKAWRAANPERVKWQNQIRQQRRVAKREREAGRGK